MTIVQLLESLGAVTGSAALLVQRTVVTDACDLSTLAITLIVGLLLPQPSSIVEKARRRNGDGPDKRKPPEP